MNCNERKWACLTLNVCSSGSEWVKLKHSTRILAITCMSDSAPSLTPCGSNIPDPVYTHCPKQKTVKARPTTSSTINRTWGLVFFGDKMVRKGTARTRPKIWHTKKFSCNSNNNEYQHKPKLASFSNFFLLVLPSQNIQVIHTSTVSRFLLYKNLNRDSHALQKIHPRKHHENQ